MSSTSSQTIFRFSETEPTPLLKDFETFCRYLEQNTFAMGKATGRLPYKPLFQLNAMMTRPQLETTTHSAQEYYPLLHLFYHLALAGKLFRVVAHKKSQTRMAATERLAAYRELTDAEKYFFLLETLWLDCSFQNLNGNRVLIPVAESVQLFLETICRLKPGEQFLCSRERGFQLNVSFLSAPVFLGFSFFGWYELVRDEAEYQYRKVKQNFPIAAVIPSHVGTTLGKKLLRERPLPDWNLPHLRTEGFLPSMPEIQAIAASNLVELFRPYCAENELHRSLPRELGKKTSGNFIFKASARPKVWRVLALSSKNTLHDLHELIQEAFEFDDDHLYAFYMDNKRYSNERFESPLGSEGPFADEIEIGELELKKGQLFLYLFDFGDQWEFTVQLLEIKTEEKLLKQPKVLETHGEAPEQYQNVETDW